MTSDAVPTPQNSGRDSDNGQVARYLTWVDSELDRREAYHHHKEMMAWTATAAYFVVVPLAYTSAPYLGNAWMRLAFTVSLVLAVYATAVFVTMQFEMRWQAADMIRGLRRCRGLLSRMTDSKFFEACDTSIRSREPGSDIESQFWPAFVQDEINACVTRRQPLLKTLLWLLWPKYWDSVNVRRRSELASYVILLLATTLALLAIWVPSRAPVNSARQATPTVAPMDSSLMEIGTVGQWAAAAITFLAVLVALFKDELLRWWRRPKLAVSIPMRPPDCQKTTLNYTVQHPTLLHASADCYYLRLWIENMGKTRAERVQVFAAKLLRKNSDRSFMQVEDFFPMNLRWTHGQPGSLAPVIFADGISSEMGMHCDLGHLIDPAHYADLGQTLPAVVAGQTILALDLEVAPNTKSHLIPPGVYQLYLRIAAANCKPITRVIELNITGRWFADQDHMFSDGIGIRVVD